MPDPRARWHASLRVLGQQLRDEALAQPGHWKSRTLSHGAAISCRVHPVHGAIEFRVARVRWPDTREGYQRWQQECAVFARHLDCHGWTERQGRTRSGGIAHYWLNPERTLFAAPVTAAVATQAPAQETA